MNLLGNVLYDPAVAVTKGAAASVLAVFDTTNARITFVVPPSGMVRVVIQCVVHGAITFSQIVLGCLEGATVRGRVTPVGSLNGTALATTMMTQNVDYVVSGLTPGASLTWDAAWGIETFVASSLIKYGGPNNTTANDAFGALIFQIWDPCPIYTPTSATAPTTTVSARIDTIDDFVDTEVSAIKTKTDFLPSATAGAAGGVLIAGSNAATTYATLTSTGAFTVNGVSAVSQTGDAFARLGAPAGASVSADVAAINAKTTNLPAAPASTTNITAGTITTTTNLTNAPTAGDFTAAMKTSLNAATPASVVGAVGSVTGLTASDVGAIKLKTDNLPSDPADQSLIIAATDAVMTRLGAPAGASVSADVAAVKADTAAVKLKTDNLPASPAATGAAMTLTAGERTSVADALLGRNIAGGSSAGRLVKDSLAFLRNKWTVAGGVLTVYDTDDTTVLWTAAVGSDAAALPVVSSDPD